MTTPTTPPPSEMAMKAAREIRYLIDQDAFVTTKFGRPLDAIIAAIIDRHFAALMTENAGLKLGIEALERETDRASHNSMRAATDYERRILFSQNTSIEIAKTRDQLRAELAALTEKAGRLEQELENTTGQRDKFARWISNHRENFDGDHACQQCYPNSDCLIPGFVCSVHEAKALTKPALQE